MSTEARDPRRVIAEWSAGMTDIDMSDFDTADDVLAALEAAGLTIVPRTDEWEWGLYCAEDDFYVSRDGQLHAQMTADENFTVVRRRPAGKWEVVPNAEG